MSIDFRTYLFEDMKEHLEQLKDEAYKDNPELENVDYHYDKVLKIIGIIQEREKE